MRNVQLYNFCSKIFSPETINKEIERGYKEREVDPRRTLMQKKNDTVAKFTYLSLQNKNT